ncbi:MAG: 2-succinyl-6-hydroxy-2,4-cyclohexadiene-carboxylic acid synthase/2-oxoglutarate decarboxylase [Frankiales bacterium]|nr:2-succinyl-6-hydroxy-2,4-cyclohexadiene-carboxylic acid synthase/2-oxoglutarate decarboxylase [Frankiales bacterium]
MNPSTALATVVVDELVRGGVRDAVLCPGSRSAPFAFALAAADTAGRLRLHVRIDERSAAFLALGLAKAGDPVAVITTSGTAVANLHPAVLEASHAGIPLVVLTADRPAELRGTGANQTTDQVGVFGTAPRIARDLGVPEARAGQVAAWRGTVSRALAAAGGGLAGGAAGPVHLNVPLREPLVPDADPTPWPESLEGRPGEAPWTDVVPRPVASAPAGADTPRTLVLVGDLPHGLWGERAARLAEANGWPLVAEPSSGGAWRAALPHGALLLGSEHWMAGHRPDRVLAVGHLTLGRAMSRLLADPHVAVDVVSDGDAWPDPAQRARSVSPLTALCAEPEGGTLDRTWLDEWQAASAAVAAAVAGLLDADEHWPSGTAVAREVLAALPEEAVLFVGSSNPVRDVQLAAVPGPVTVVANRGLAGIDGSVSTASGVALTSTAPTYALMGDLTFLHDAGGLVRGPVEPRPDLTLVVVNDDGGGIFGLLEPGAARHAAVFERVFGTPHGVDLAALCAATGTPHERVSTRGELRAALAAVPRGLRVVEVRVDRTGHPALHDRLREATDGALRG